MLLLLEGHPVVDLVVLGGADLIVICERQRASPTTSQSQAWCR